MKKYLIGTTIAVAALASTALFADPQGENHARHRDGATTESSSGKHAGRGHMQRMHERMAQRHGKQEGQGKQDMHRDNAGEDCPMHNRRKPS
jgi:hypothetical protein